MPKVEQSAIHKMPMPSESEMRFKNSLTSGSILKHCTKDTELHY